jgi:hypothetical protein
MYLFSLIGVIANYCIQRKACHFSEQPPCNQTLEKGLKVSLVSEYKKREQDVPLERNVTSPLLFTSNYCLTRILSLFKHSFSLSVFLYLNAIQWWYKHLEVHLCLFSMILYAGMVFWLEECLEFVLVRGELLPSSFSWFFFTRRVSDSHSIGS